MRRSEKVVFTHTLASVAWPNTRICSGDLLEEITAILPGAGAPTVMPLSGRDDAVAVHAVCQEAVFWETLERLKAAGASAILVLPIEKMM